MTTSPQASAKKKGEIHGMFKGMPNLGPKEPRKEREWYTKDEVNEKLKTVLSICEKRGGMHDTLNEIIYVDVKEEREWRKALLEWLDEFECRQPFGMSGIDDLRKRFL